MAWGGTLLCGNAGRQADPADEHRLIAGASVTRPHGMGVESESEPQAKAIARLERQNRELRAYQALLAARGAWKSDIVQPTSPVVVTAR